MKTLKEKIDFGEKIIKDFWENGFTIEDARDVLEVLLMTNLKQK